MSARALFSLLGMLASTAAFGAAGSPAVHTAVPARGGIRVLINGQDATGVRHIQLKLVNVRFDAQGNVHIEAPQYDIKVRPGITTTAKGAPAAGSPSLKTPLTLKQPTQRPTRRYFISLDSKDASLIGCRVQVLVGGTLVGEHTGLEQVPFKEITASLSRGVHKLTLRCRRPPGAVPKVADLDPKRLRDAYFEVKVGRGHVDGKRAVIDQPYGTFRCTDRTSGLVEKQFPIQVE